MGLALTFSVLGLIAIVIDVGVSPIQDKVLHALLGTATLVLAFIQPILAATRCAPSHQLRPLFNWVHGLIGLTVLILGWVSSYFTTELTMKVVPYYFGYLLYGVLAWIILSHSVIYGYKIMKAGEAQNSLEDDKNLKIFGSIFATVLTGTVIALAILVIINS